MVDLTTQQRQLVHTVLRRRFPDRQARVFGSRASGPSKPWSDLDLVILGSQPVSDLALAEARGDFEASDAEDSIERLTRALKNRGVSEKLLDEALRDAAK